MCQTLIFVCLLWAFLLTLPSIQTIKVIDLIFFLNELALKNWAMNMHINSIPILIRPFSRGGLGRLPPRLYIDSDPPAFTGLNIYLYALHV